MPLKNILFPPLAMILILDGNPYTLYCKKEIYKLYRQRMALCTNFVPD